MHVNIIQVSKSTELKQGAYEHKIHYFGYISVSQTEVSSTGAQTCSYNYCVELHWHSSFHKFNINFIFFRFKK